MARSHIAHPTYPQNAFQSPKIAVATTGPQSILSVLISCGRSNVMRWRPFPLRLHWRAVRHDSKRGIGGKTVRGVKGEQLQHEAAKQKENVCGHQS